MAYAFGAPSIVQDGLVFYVDAANKDSYVNGSSDTFSLANLSLTGSLKNNTSFISSNAGVWDFDGSDDYIDFGTGLGNNLGNYSGNLSFSLWAKTANTTSEVGLLSLKTVDSNDTATSISMYSNILRLTYGAGANKVLVSTSTAGITANNWFQVVGIYTPNEDGKIYVNGNLQSVTSGGTSPSSINFTGLGFYIGTYYNLTYNFDGQVSNVLIFNKELSAQEVLQNYNALKPRFN